MLQFLFSPKTLFLSLDYKIIIFVYTKKKKIIIDSLIIKSNNYEMSIIEF